MEGMNRRRFFLAATGAILFPKICKSSITYDGLVRAYDEMVASGNEPDSIIIDPSMREKLARLYKNYEYRGYSIQGAIVRPCTGLVSRYIMKGWLVDTLPHKWKKDEAMDFILYLYSQADLWGDAPVNVRLMMQTKEYLE